MKRLGMTLIELLIALAIIGLLIAILMPAVQGAREMARRMECSNRMRQIAIAVHNYESTHRVLPAANMMGHSYLVGILPQLELESVYQQVRHEQGGAIALDNPLYKIPVAQFTCPSDGNSQQVLRSTDTVYPTNYLGNRGVNTVDCGYNGYLQESYPDPYGGGWLKMAEITDGQASTAMLSETVVGDSILATPTFFGPGQYAAFIEACTKGPYLASPNGGIDVTPSRGACWCRADPDFTTYSHDLTPNLTACKNGNDLYSAALPPNSNHPRGAMVVYGDAHLSFVSDAVDAAVWRAVGSRNGNETPGKVP